MTTSYWLEEEADPIPRRPLAGRAEVEVIGGGVTGCACALTLARAGVRVRVHEARRVAGGASGRNGGFALRGGKGPYDEARAALGPGSARRLWQLTEETLDRIEVLAGDAFHRVGSLRLAADPAERDALRAEFEALRKDGFAVEWADALDPPLDRFPAALFHPHDGALQPARWVRRLARLAADEGAEIVEGSEAVLGQLEADVVVVAADGFTGSVIEQLGGAVWPVRGQVLVTEPLPERLFECPHYSRGGYDYWQQLPDGRLVVGGRRDASFETEETGVEETTPRIQGAIEALVADLVGRAPRVTHRWAGIFGMTADGLPLVGRVPGRDGVWVAGGYSGHGNVLGFACGVLVANAILGRPAAEATLFDPDRPL